MSWTHVAPTVLASFMASLVEGVEALTVVLAVGTVRGWRSALAGTATALLVLLLLVATFGQSISKIPLPLVQLFVGTLLLMFGLRWLRKAVLRSAGVIALHDETATYAKQTESLRTQAPVKGGRDKIAFVTSFKIVMLEGIEVVFIVIAIGANGQMILPASIGALAALVLVVLLGIWLHRPLGNIPENALKFGVGVLLAAFGTFWVGEGVHLSWPGEDWAILELTLAYFLLAYVLVLICRARARRAVPQIKKGGAKTPKSVVGTVIEELIGLFVDDGSLAIGIVAWVVIVWLSAGKLPLMMLAQCGFFFLGFASLLTYSATRAAHH